MNLVHFSSEAQPDLLRLLSTESRTIPGTYSDKPLAKRLWVSDEDAYGWSAWALDNEYRTESLAYAHEVILRPGARILVLDSPEAIAACDARYGKLQSNEFGRWLRLNWKAIAADYDVVIAYPNNRPSSSDHHWLETWDCASGVVLDPVAIKAIGNPKPSGFDPNPPTGGKGIFIVDISTNGNAVEASQQSATAEEKIYQSSAWASRRGLTYRDVVDRRHGKVVLRLATSRMSHDAMVRAMLKLDELRPDYATDDVQSFVDFEGRFLMGVRTSNKAAAAAICQAVLGGEAK